MHMVIMVIYIYGYNMVISMIIVLFRYEDVLCWIGFGSSHISFGSQHTDVKVMLTLLPVFHPPNLLC